MPRSASSRAVDTPATPPPITQTAALRGRVWSGWTLAIDRHGGNRKSVDGCQLVARLPEECHQTFRAGEVHCAHCNEGMPCSRIAGAACHDMIALHTRFCSTKAISAGVSGSVGSLRSDSGVKAVMEALVIERDDGLEIVKRAGLGLGHGEEYRA